MILSLMRKSKGKRITLKVVVSLDDKRPLDHFTQGIVILSYKRGKQIIGTETKSRIFFEFSITVDRVAEEPTHYQHFRDVIKGILINNQVKFKTFVFTEV